MAATPKRASATSPTTRDSATIGVPVAASVQTSPSSCIGSNSTVSNTGETLKEDSSSELNERSKKLRKMAEFYEQELQIFQNLGIPLTLDEAAREEVDEMVAALDLYTETVKTHRKAVVKVSQGMVDLECNPNEDGLLPDDYDFLYSMLVDAVIFESEWDEMTEVINSIISKVKDGQPGSINELLQFKDLVVKVLDYQFINMSSVQQKIDELCSLVKKCQVSSPADCEQ